MNANETALLDPFEVSTPDEAMELSALVRALEMAEGFRLIFVRCNQIPQRERLMEEVRAHLPKLNIQTISFREPIQHLLDSIQQQLASPLPDAVFVSGLEFSLPVAAEAPAAPLVANLNASRNSFAQLLPCPVVLWVPEYALTAIAQGAPDFFSIRSSVYFFAATPDEIAHLAQNLSAGEWWEVDNLSHTEKQDRIIAIQRLLADYKSLSEKQQDSFTERRLIGQLGALFDAQGDYEAALSQYDHSLKMAEKLGDPEGIAISLHEIGNLYYQRGEYEAALSLYERSQKIFEELDHRMGVASSLHQMGRTQAELGEYDAALSLYEQSLKMFEEADNVAGVASSLHQIGMVQQACENYEAALNYYESSLRLKKSLGNIAGVASSLHQIGNLNYLRGEYTAALEQYEQSLKIAEELGDRVGMATTRAQLSKVFIQLGRYPDAFRNLLFALTTFVELQLPYMRLAANELKKLRIQWGAANFNSAWQQTTGEDVPEWLSQDEGAQT